MLSGKQVMIVAEEGFEDLELIEPLRAMKDMNARVTIFGSTPKYYDSRWQVSLIRPDASPLEISARELDAIIIPGGNAPDTMRSNQAMLQLLQEANHEGKIIAAISRGPLLLISANLVHGRHLTSWPSIAMDLVNAGATWINSPVVRDLNLITSRKPADIPKFNKELIHALARSELGKYTARQTLN
jgi:protease I